LFTDNWPGFQTKKPPARILTGHEDGFVNGAIRVYTRRGQRPGFRLAAGR